MTMAVATFQSRPWASQSLSVGLVCLLFMAIWFHVENYAESDSNLIKSRQLVSVQDRKLFDFSRPGYKRPEQYSSKSYIPRGKSGANKKALAKEWGQWKWTDPRDGSLANLYDTYPSRDVPYDQFPSSAWQKKPALLKQFLPEGLALVERAMEAILTSYGHGKKDQPGVDFAERAQMFELYIRPSKEDRVDVSKYSFVKRGKTENHRGGWSTQRSLDGLARRVLHSIMTQDTFTFAMGGHSASAGHGNHFQQSYALQVGKLLEPVFARLGVKFTAHNFGMGGLGTIQNSMAAGDLYGRNLDVLMWDSGMTEPDPASKRVFMRQGILGSDRAPFLIDIATEEAVFDYHVDAMWRAACMSGVAVTDSVAKANELPFLVQYLRCDAEMRTICRQNEYRGTCWIERSDVTPDEKQRAEPGGRASWHPGERQHAIVAHNVAFQILRATHQALKMWNDAPDYKLPDDTWHMDAYAANIRSRVLEMNTTQCEALQGPDRLCTLRMNGRSENTPRSRPESTSIRSIMKPGHGGILEPTPNQYDPPDVFLPDLHPPNGAFDYLAVVENGVPFADNLMRGIPVEHPAVRPAMNRIIAKGITPGQGFGLSVRMAADNCDGTYDSFCGKSGDCLLYGANDGRGGIRMDGLSGWMILNLPDLQHGLIILKFETWHLTNSVVPTEGWKCEDGGTGCAAATRRLEAHEKRNESDVSRDLKGQPPPFCDDFKFEYAIDGQFFSMSKDEFLERKQQTQRVVELVTLLDDPAYMQGKIADVEVAFRMTGCGRTKVFNLSHVYWS